MTITVPFPEDPGVSGGDLELEVNIRSTREFIYADPITITLLKRVTEPDGAGGYRTLVPEPRDPQTFRLIPQTDVMPEVQSPDGVRVVPTYVLLGLPDQVLERWDTFNFNDIDYIVTSPVRPDVRILERAYYLKADVARL